MNDQAPKYVNKNHTIEYIKRKAKNIKKEQNITHTQALEVIAKECGYSNWKHCQQSLNGNKNN
jgi:hypothetical protein